MHEFDLIITTIFGDRTICEIKSDLTAKEFAKKVMEEGHAQETDGDIICWSPRIIGSVESRS